MGKKDYDLYNYYFSIKKGLSGDARSIGQHLMLISKFIFVLTELRIQMDYD